MCPENPGTQQVDSMSKGRAEAAADKNQKIVHRLSLSLKASRPASIVLRMCLAENPSTRKATSRSVLKADEKRRHHGAAF
jgi:hypothetical protein